MSEASPIEQPTWMFFGIAEASAACHRALAWRTVLGRRLTARLVNRALQRVGACYWDGDGWQPVDFEIEFEVEL
jgi:hypothetical protein